MPSAFVTHPWREHAHIIRIGGDVVVNDMITEIRFWSQVMTDAKRTVFCSPDMESRCKGYVEARGMGGLITVKASPAVPDDRLFIVDEGAIEAATNEALARPVRFRLDWP